ncbi:unnamed protein product [Symbiodinium sp. CCMP2592]|nr:unnamed protein product [Symbiodinium sp. CCMP2592]
MDSPLRRLRQGAPVAQQRRSARSRTPDLQASKPAGSPKAATRPRISGGKLCLQFQHWLGCIVGCLCAAEAEAFDVKESSVLRKFDVISADNKSTSQSGDRAHRREILTVSRIKHCVLGLWEG